MTLIAKDPHWQETFLKWSSNKKQKLTSLKILLLLKVALLHVSVWTRTFYSQPPMDRFKTRISIQTECWLRKHPIARYIVWFGSGTLSFNCNIFTISSTELCTNHIYKKSRFIFKHVMSQILRYILKKQRRKQITTDEALPVFLLSKFSSEFDW